MQRIPECPFCVSNKSFLASTSIASVFLALTTIHSIAAPAACPSPIPFGLTTPLTGNLALLGTQARNGAEFAVDEINAVGGIAGKKIAAHHRGHRRLVDRRSECDELHHSRASRWSSCRLDDLAACVCTDRERQQIRDPVHRRRHQRESHRARLEVAVRTHAHDGQLAELIPEYLVKSLARRQARHSRRCRRLRPRRVEGHSGGTRQTQCHAGRDTSYAPSDKDMSAQLLEIKDKGADSLILFGVLQIHPGAEADGRSRHQADHHRQYQHCRADHPEQSVRSRSRRQLRDRGHDPPNLDRSENSADWAKRVQDKYKVPADNFTVSYYDSVSHAEVDHREGRLRQSRDPRCPCRHQGLARAC